MNNCLFDNHLPVFKNLLNQIIAYNFGRRTQTGVVWH